MRIVHINSVCDVGSTGRIAASICRETMKEGNECIIAYGREKCVSKDLCSVRIGTDFDVAIHLLLSRCFDRQGFGSKRATLKFLHQLENFHPDVMYLHNLHGYYINIEILFQYIKKNNIKVIWTLHDAWSFTGHCAWDETYNCEQWRDGCKKCKHKKKYPRCDFLSNSKENYKRKMKAFTGVKDLTIIAPSEWLANLVRESFLKEYEVVVKHNTIDTSVFHCVKSDFRERYGLSNIKLYLCVMFAPNSKKMNDLCKISDMLNNDEKMIIVGLSEKNLEQVKHYKNIIAFPRTDSREELVKIYSSCDVYVNPTYADNYPTVNLESEACGTPVVCYDVGGCKETLRLSLSRCVHVGDYCGLLNEARNIVNNKGDVIQ